MTVKPGFEYDEIPAGYYDRVLEEGHPVQRAWHAQKFSRVRELLALGEHARLLDVGCGPGTFLGGFQGPREGELVGIDISRPQIEYAESKYGTPWRRFVRVDSSGPWPFESASFDSLTMIEVIEHLDRERIQGLSAECARVLKPGSTFVLTTPNYTSHWPLLEWMVGRLSKVKYEEQHVTRFHRPFLRRELARVLGDRFELEYATTIHFVAPFLAPLSRGASDRVARALTPRHWFWPFGALIIARLRFLG